jgi:glycerol-3-phosphate dehydrogenase
MSLLSATGEKAILKDEIEGELLEVRPKVVVNAGGPWIDQINRAIGVDTRFIGGTKGSHLVLDHPELREAIGDHEFFFENQDGRIVLIFPFEDRVLIGTSDIEIDDPDQAVVTEEEVAYFFDMIDRVFPGIDVDKSQIVFTYSGVRPLTNTRARFTGQISRDHEIEVTEAGGSLSYPVYSLIGGKWTTYRAFSEQVCDRVLERLNRSRAESTRNRPIGGAKGYPQDEKGKELFITGLLREHGGSRATIETLCERYGARAGEFLNGDGSGGNKPLAHFPDYTKAEIKHLVRCEDVVHLDDLILRRSLIGPLGRVTEDGLKELTQVAGEALKWNEEKIREEIARVIDLLRTRHRVNFNRYCEDLA